MEHAWKVCVRLSVPRVRIPPFPPDTRKPAYAGFFVSGGKGGIDSYSWFEPERSGDQRPLGVISFFNHHVTQNKKPDPISLVLRACLHRGKLNPSYFSNTKMRSFYL